MNKDYNLTGRTIRVRRKIKGETAGEPWAYDEQKMKVIKEYPEFLRCEVLPHMNPRGMDTSRPYITCLDKHDIQTGEIIINGGEAK